MKRKALDDAPTGSGGKMIRGSDQLNEKVFIQTRMPPPTLSLDSPGSVASALLKMELMRCPESQELLAFFGMAEESKLKPCSPKTFGATEASASMAPPESNHLTSRPPSSLSEALDGNIMSRSGSSLSAGFDSYIISRPGSSLSSGLDSHVISRPGSSLSTGCEANRRSSSVSDPWLLGPGYSSSTWSTSPADLAPGHGRKISKSIGDFGTFNHKEFLTWLSKTNQTFFQTLCWVISIQYFLILQ